LASKPQTDLIGLLDQKNILPVKEEKTPSGDRDGGHFLMLSPIAASGATTSTSLS